MSAPRDLMTDPARRGPAGTELMGVSVALPLKETVDPDTGQPWSEQDWRDAVRHYQPGLLDQLQKHVGGARFHTEPQLNLDGPHSDPLQGPIYVLTVSAWFSPAALPVDCPAYIARSKEARRG